MQKQIVYGIEPSGDLKILPSLDGDVPRLFAGYDASGKFLGVVIEASDLAMFFAQPGQRDK